MENNTNSGSRGSMSIKKLVQLIEQGEVTELYIGELDKLQAEAGNHPALQNALQGTLQLSDEMDQTLQKKFSPTLGIKTRSIMSGKVPGLLFPWVFIILKDGQSRFGQISRFLNSNIKKFERTAVKQNVRVLNYTANDLEKENKFSWPRLILYLSPIWIFLICWFFVYLAIIIADYLSL